jgi:hypothetical protein
MNMYYDDGGSAFPWPPVGTGDPRDGMAGGSSGMSLRDYFAAAALQGLLAESHSMGMIDCDARAAYQYADAMLAERAKTKGGSA